MCIILTQGKGRPTDGGGTSSPGFDNPSHLHSVLLFFFFPAHTRHPSVISEVLQYACKVGRDGMTGPI